MQGISTEELAGRYKQCVLRLAILKQCSDVKLADSIDSVVDSLAQLLMLSVVAAGPQQLELQCLNFETMQHEAISDDLWVKVADVMRLTPEQRRKVHLAFDCYGPQRTSLLQQQQQLVQELRGLLGSPGSSPCKQPAGAASTSTASGSSGALSTRTFAAAGAPRGAAVGSSRGSPGSSAAGSLGSAHTLLCSLGAPAAGSGAGQKAAHPSQASRDPSIQRFASSSDGAGNGAGSDGHATARVASSSLVPGTMDLHACIQAEQVLAKLDRNIQLQRAASLQLLYFYIYLLSSQQHADALLAAYPYSIKVPAVLAHVSRQEAASAASSED